MPSIMRRALLAEPAAPGKVARDQDSDGLAEGAEQQDGGGDELDHEAKLTPGRILRVAERIQDAADDPHDADGGDDDAGLVLRLPEDVAEPQGWQETLQLPACSPGCGTARSSPGSPVMVGASMPDLRRAPTPITIQK